MKRQRDTLDEKRDLVRKVDELFKKEEISIKAAYKRLDIPYRKCYAAMNAINNENRTAKAENRALAVASTSSSELKVALVFKGDAAKLIKEYVDIYSVEPEAMCRILLVNALNDKKKLSIQ